MFHSYVDVDQTSAFSTNTCSQWLTQSLVLAPVSTHRSWLNPNWPKRITEVSFFLLVNGSGTGP